MIYDFPDEGAPLRQGDIFIGLPRVDLSLNKVLIVTETKERIAPWDEVGKRGEPVNIIVPVRPVAAIVATQDCDALRSRDITLCEIRKFRDVEGKSRETSSPKKWKDIITQHSRINSEVVLSTSRRQDRLYRENGRGLHGHAASTERGT